MRIVPSIINIGDSYDLEVGLPDAPASETWSRVDITLRRLRDSENTRFTEYTETIDGNLAALAISAASSTTWADGVYRYAITATSDAGSVKTIENSVVDVQNALDPQLTYNERMVLILENVIVEKMEGRADILKYGIADRTTETMTLDELTKALSDFREALALDRRGGRPKVFMSYQTR